MSRKAEAAGPVGAVIAAAACPICFPKLAALGALVGLGALAPYEAYFLWAAQLLVVLTLAVQFIAYRRYRTHGLMLAFSFFTGIFFLSLYGVPSEWLTYAALTGIVGCTIWSLASDVNTVRCDSAACSTTSSRARSSADG